MKNYRSTPDSNSRQDQPMEANEQNYGELFNNTLGLFCTHDLSGIILSLNPASAASLEQKEEDLLGTNIRDLLAPNWKMMFDEYLNQILREKVAEGVMHVISALGKSRYWAYRNVRIDTPGKPSYVVGLSQDITCRIQLEKELKLAKEKETELRKSRELFFASMSHELRTPLNAITGFTGLLLGSELSRTQHEYINAIDSAGKNLLAVVNDILDMGKLEAGKMVYEEVAFSSHKVISSVIDLFRAQAVKNGIRLIKKTDAKVPDLITGDPVRLNQILINLIGNALKFTEKGSVVVQVKAEKIGSEEVNMSFIISDTGIGIGEDSLSELFQTYSQAGSDMARKYGGTGLGLSIVKQLVDGQNGTIQVRSNPGKGSAFTVTIPYRLVLKKQLTPGQKNGPMLPLLSHLTILIADDDSLNQKFAVEILKEYGAVLELAKNGKEAVEKVKLGKFDLVLMDVNMPVMNGLEATRAIRAKAKSKVSEIPIVALTADATENERQRCLEAGMNEYLSKPFDPILLIGKINTVLGLIEQDTSENETQKLIYRPADFKSSIDLNYLKAALKNKKNLIGEVMELFISNVPLMMEEIESFYKKGKKELLGQAIHKIKSNLAIMGMDDVVKLADTIEEDTKRNGTKAMLAPMIMSLSVYCKEAVKEVRELIKQGSEFKTC